MSENVPQHILNLALLPDWMAFQSALIAHPEWNTLGASPQVSMIVAALQDYLTRLAGGEFGFHNERVAQFRMLWSPVRSLLSVQFLSLIIAKSEECRLPSLMREIISENFVPPTNP